MKKSKMKGIAFVLVFALMMGGLPVFAAEFSDIEGHLCEEAVYELTELGVINGFPDGTFRPDAFITRAEAAKLLALALSTVSQGEAPQFSDTKGHWAESYIGRGVEMGLIQGYPDGTFKPDSNISQYEMKILVIRALGYTDEVMSGEDYLNWDPSEHGVSAEISAYLQTTPAEDMETRASAVMWLYEIMRLPLGSVIDGEYVLDEDGATYLDMLKARHALAQGDILRPFTLAGYYEDGMINAAPVAEDLSAYVWSPDRGEFVGADADAETIVYSFAAVIDTLGAGEGDTILIVNREDAPGYWDEEMTYKDPRFGTYADAYDNEYNIPFGERILGFMDEDGFLDGAVYDYLNIVKPGDLAASTYWPTYDWFHSQGSATRTYLTGFRTIQQASGWSCGVTSLLMAMDWYDLRDGLNEFDLGALRNTKEKYGAYRWGSATDVQMMINVFDSLNDMYGENVWSYESTYDFVDESGNLSDEYLSTDWIIETLSEGRPILVGWNSFGGHWQVIIGYDTMGTEATADDVLILADPYDSTDHRNDGYNIQSYERLYYDWTQTFDRDFSANNDYGMTDRKSVV